MSPAMKVSELGSLEERFKLKKDLKCRDFRYIISFFFFSFQMEKKPLIIKKILITF